MTNLHVYESPAIWRHVALLASVLGLTVNPAQAADGTVIGELAESLQPGEWAELTTNNIGILAAPGAGSTHSIQEYTTGGAWDPVNKVLYFIGSSDPHIADDDGKFVTYSAATNTWTHEPDPSWFPGPGEVQHSYDHHTFDPTRGTFYYRPFQLRDIHAFDVASRTWSRAPDIFSYSDWVVCCSGLEYFPERDSLIWNNLDGGGDGRSEIMEWPIGASDWTVLSTTPGMGNHHGFTTYNPVHGVIWMGGGIPRGGRPQNCSDCTYMLDAQGNITNLPAAPFDLAGIDKFSLIVADPVSGMFLIFTGQFHDTNPNQFWTFDITNGTWEQQGTSGVPVFPVWQTTVVALPNYGAIMFPKYDGANSTVWLYKHRQQIRPLPPEGLNAQ